jgi:hypothetical protein
MNYRCLTGLTLTLLLLIILIINTNSGFGVISEGQFYFVTYHTDSNDHRYQFLMNQMNKLGYNNDVNTHQVTLGLDTTWNGWYGRITGYQTFVKTLNPDDYVLFYDGGDVLINEPFEVFKAKALVLYSDKKRIIFGAERNCCTPNSGNRTEFDDNQNRKIMKETNELKNGYDYLNFGLAFGKAKDFVKLFEKMDMKPGDMDQSLAYKLYADNPEDYYLDRQNIIFSNSPKVWEKSVCQFKWNSTNKSFINTDTGTIPSFIQFPGKHWDCYDSLYKKLKDI